MPADVDSRADLTGIAYRVTPLSAPSSQPVLRRTLIGGADDLPGRTPGELEVHVECHTRIKGAHHGYVSNLKVVLSN